MRNQKKLGVIISYLNIVLNMLITMFFTPFLLRNLGPAEYGVYRIIRSFAGQLSIMSFGLSTVVARNIVFYDTKKQKEEKQNFLFIANIISVSLMVLVFAVGTVMYQFIDLLYGKSFSYTEMLTAKKLFVLFILNVGFTIFGDCFTGTVKGHEKFAVTYLAKTFKLVARVIVIIVLLKLGFKSVAIITTDLCLTIIVILFEIFYSRFSLKERPKFKFWDRAMIKTTFFFSAAVFLQAIINQVNQNMDSVILGSMTNAETVAMYSLALTIFVTFCSVTNTISSVFAPQATRMIYSGSDSEEMTDLVIRTGRIQFIIASAVICGFILYGNTFINLWVGQGYNEVYKIVLILLIPAVIPMITSVSNAILDAKLLRLGRSIILLIMAIFNLVASIIMIKIWGYIGAALGTAGSYIIGYGIANNIYLKRKLNLNIKRMYLEILKGILPCALITTVVLIPTVKLIPHNLIGFIIDVIIFLTVYFVLLYIFGFNKDEKQRLIKQPLKKIFGKKSRGV